MITPPWFNTPTETLAFNAYAFSESEVMRLADEIQNGHNVSVEASQYSALVDELARRGISINE